MSAEFEEKKAMKLKYLFLIHLLLITCVFSSKPPTLTPKETKRKIEEILSCHVSYKTFNAEIAKRALKNFVDELDPLKTYFIKAEIEPWETPSNETINRTLEGYNKGDFAEFERIHMAFIKSVERRERLEEKVLRDPLPEPGPSMEIKNLPYVDTEDLLLDRLRQIRALQEEAAEKLDDSVRPRLQQLWTKRRLSRENDLIGGKEQERNQRMLGCVLKALSTALDAHTAYFTPTEASQFLIQVEQRLFGIGVQLRDELNGLTIMRIIEGAPSTGLLKKEDRIIAVNGEPIIGLDTSDAVELIRGPKGSAVMLTLIRNDESFDIEVIRDEIVLKENRFDTHLEPFGDGVIAHLALYSFYQDPASSSSSDLKAEIEKIRENHHLKGVILDLRNNTGGLMTQAVAVSGLFIKKGVVVSTKDCHGRVAHLRNFDAMVTWEGPLLVLVNKVTISAAEIVAQSLQEYGRALLVGDASTFGKGSYQTFTLESPRHHKVNPEGEYKVTRGLYYTVSGHSPQLHGAKSDVVIPGVYSASEIGESESKFALEPGSITPNFEDKLEDIHPLHRLKMKRVYLNNLQEKEVRYTPYLNILRENSKARIDKNQNYQSFLKLLKKEEDIEAPSSFTDLQLEEAVNVMKDLLFLKKTG